MGSRAARRSAQHRHKEQPGMPDRPLVYVLGLDAGTRRAVQADVPQARVRRLRSVRAWAGCRPGAAPDLVVLDLGRAAAVAEREAIRRRWGSQVPMIDIDPSRPIAHVWRGQMPPESIELGPGCLTALLPHMARETGVVRRGAWTACPRVARLAGAIAVSLLLIAGTLAYTRWSAGGVSPAVSFDAPADLEERPYDGDMPPLVERCGDDECG
jgi:hypothetical protein